MSKPGTSTSLSPLDDRYRHKTKALTSYFCETALNRLRLEFEIEYLIFFVEQVLDQKMPANQKQKLLSLVKNFDQTQAERLSAIETKTRHDVKAVEYYLREKLQTLELARYQPYVHFGLTSEDCNNFAYTLAVKRAHGEVLLPAIRRVIRRIGALASEYQDDALLALTHGQPAVPTTMGKELMVFAIRLNKLVKKLENQVFEVKLNGAVGNYNALALAFPQKNWPKLSQKLAKNFGFRVNLWTTQVLPTENLVEIFNLYGLVNSILIDFNQDLWGYISREIFIQKFDKESVGSSTMPHKVNPIDFENSEGNLVIANALLTSFVQKLPISRFQRDLSDSTIKRNFGVAFGHSLLGFESCLKGLSKLTLNKPKMNEELDANWQIITEGIQTMLKAHGDEKGYEKLKGLSHGKKLTPTQLKNFVEKINLPDKTKQQLLKLTPKNYLGLAKQLTKLGLKELI